MGYYEDFRKRLEYSLESTLERDQKLIKLYNEFYNNRRDELKGRIIPVDFWRECQKFIEREIHKVQKEEIKKTRGLGRILGIFQKKR